MRERFKTWLEETHGTRFELLRHFLARFFDSELVSTPGEWAKVGVGVLSMALCAWLILGRIFQFKYGMLVRSGLADRIAAEIQNDRLTLVVLAMCATTLLVAVLWESIFPTLRDYLALAALPIRPIEIFSAKLTALLLVFVVHVLVNIGSTAFVFAGATKGHASLGGIFLAMTAGSLVIFFGVIAVQGLMLNFLPARVFERISVWVQALLVTASLGGFSFFAWKAPQLFAGWSIPPAVVLGTPVAAFLIYWLSYHRYRRLLLEAPLTRAPERRDTFERLLEYWIKDARELAAFSFIWKTINRNRVHRLALLIYFGLGIAWIAKSAVEFLSAPGVRGDFSKFLLVTGALTLAMFTLLGLRYLFSLPADLRANWMFQITEREGRVAWLNAVARFVLWFGVAPIVLAGGVLVARNTGPFAAIAWCAQAFVLGAIVFEYLFRNWRKLPFTCSYLPGKRPLVFTIGLYIGLMPLVFPIGYVLSVGATNPASFMILILIELALWRRMRATRMTTWGVFPLKYQEQHDVDVETYDLAGDGTTVAQEQFQREWTSFLRSGPDIPIVSDLDQYETRGERVLKWIKAIPHDLRYSVRTLRKNPGFALGAILTLGLGLGLNAAFFAVFNAFVLKPVAVRDPGSLYELQFRTRDNQRVSLSPEEYEAFRGADTGFTESTADVRFGTGLEGRAAIVNVVSRNYFAMLGVRTERGRTFGSDERDQVLVLSYKTWQNRFGADENILGRKLLVQGHPFEVIGVCSPEFAGLQLGGADFWVPFEVWHNDLKLPLGDFVSITARLRRGLQDRRAQAMLTAYGRRITSDRELHRQIYRAEVESKAIPITWTALRYFLPLLLAFGLTMAIPCANAANIMLARAMVRQRELGVRLSLGASRGRIVRQLLTEGAVIAACGGIAGLALARFSLDIFQRAIHSTAPPSIIFRFRMPELVLDYRVFVYMLLVVGLTTITFAFAPSAQATRSAVSAFLRGEFGALRASRLRDTLVIAQVAGCVLLLVIAAVFLRSTRRITAVDRGYDARGVYGVLNQSLENTEAMQRILERAPWVDSISFLGSPLTDMQTVQIASTERSAWHTSYFNFGSPGYFRVLRIPLIRGRTFHASEADSRAAVVVVSETAAKLLWPGQDPVGKTVAIKAADRSSRWHGRFNEAIVVGVCRDVVSRGSDRTARPSVHFPESLRLGLVLLVRGKGAPEQTFRELETALAGTTGPQLGARIVTLQETVDWETYPHQAASWLSSILGGLALLLTMTGMYGVMSYLVSQRTKEIGIRMALGATQMQVVRFVLTHTTRLTAAGLLFGVVLAAGVSQYLASTGVSLINANTTIGAMVEFYDLAAYVLCLGVVSIAALLATAGPARRASSVDPMNTLRAD